jgi:hypothetical protein
MQHATREERWIRCGVRPGMFSNEAVVELGGHYYVVERDAVRNMVGERGELRVKIIHIDGREWAVLPTNYSDSVPLATGA